MSVKTREAGSAELRKVLRRSRGLFWTAGLFSVFVNLLLLTGPLYMLMIYDRVLTSRSVETLFALTGLILFLFLMMGVLDFTRGRIFARVGANFQQRLDRRVFAASLNAQARVDRNIAKSGLNDLESVQSALASPAIGAVFDAPWSAVFIFGIWLFHPWLGMLAIGGGLLLMALTVVNAVMTRRAVVSANSAGQSARSYSESLQNEAEMVQSLGMSEGAFARWNQQRQHALHRSVFSGDGTGFFSALTKTLRMFLQSAMLGLGAYLVLQQEMTAGAMIAGSILLGRALAPVELMIAHWSQIQRAKAAWVNLSDLLGAVPPEQTRTALPRPEAKLEVRDLTVVPPGQSQAALRMVGFDLAPGQALGVIGASGAGKSTLAKALTGVWPPAGGTIRLDGAKLEQYSQQDLGRYIGYLPQRVELFDGTIGENIAALSENPDIDALTEATNKAAAHELIKRLPLDYQTPVAGSADLLSGGQLQRIGLARALYGDPVIVVLDEPNSSLDNEGTLALNTAIRRLKAEGKAVLIMAHRPAAIAECDLVLMLDRGVRKAFGPRDEVLRAVLKNHDDIARRPGPAGVT